MTTSNKTTPISIGEGNEENKMENTNLSTIDLDFFDHSVETGELTKEGRQLLIWCKKAAPHIDPETAEVNWEYRPFLDPYGVWQKKKSKVDRHYFARSPGSDAWVSWEDLPYETELSLWEKHKQTDPALCEPTSCWSAFVHSRYFRSDQDATRLNANQVAYVRLRAVGKLRGE
jgi:hypothetical protein